MKYGVLSYGGMMRLLLFAASFFMANANALVLGDDILIDSALGHPLNARIPVLQLSDADAQQFKVRLATVQEYKNLGLIYPENQKFRFELVTEPAGQSYIRVTTQRPVSDPFIDLLIETASSGWKLDKSYTILLDPAPFQDAPVEARQAPSPIESVQPAAPVPRPNPAPVPAKEPRRSHAKHHKKVAAAREEQDEHRQLKLSMSLSISTYAPSSTAGTSNDALQEELVAKEKLLNDLKLQIGEMQLVIKDLKEKEAGVAMAASSVAASGIAAVAPASAVSANGAVSRVPAVPPRRETVKPRAVSKPDEEWKKPLYTLASLLAVVSILFWFRRRIEKGSKGLFDDLKDEMASGAESPRDDVHKPPMKQPVEVKPVRISQPASEQKGPSVPPEYAALMEANKHLRAGNEEQAEEALLRAIGINPNNTYGYLALLKLYEKRGDKSNFEKIAKQLRVIGDDASFNEAARMGRGLDPENPLFSAAH